MLGGAERLLKATGNQNVRTYIDRRKSTVAQWVALRTIFKVCTKHEKGYESGGRRQPPMVIADSVRSAIEGHVIRYFGRSK